MSASSDAPNSTSQPTSTVVNANRHKCPHCPYMAPKPWKIRMHVLTCHTTTKEFQCPHCTYSTTTSAPLQVHITLHNDSQSSTVVAPATRIKSEPSKEPRSQPVPSHGAKSAVAPVLKPLRHKRVTALATAGRKIVRLKLKGVSIKLNKKSQLSKKVAKKSAAAAAKNPRRQANPSTGKISSVQAKPKPPPCPIRWTTGSSSDYVTRYFPADMPEYHGPHTNRLGMQLFFLHISRAEKMKAAKMKVNDFTLPEELKLSRVDHAQLYRDRQSGENRDSS